MNGSMYVGWRDILRERGLFGKFTRVRRGASRLQGESGRRKSEGKNKKSNQGDIEETLRGVFCTPPGGEGKGLKENNNNY